jgi:Ca2+-binding RTX toxin-like protein
MSTVTVTGSAGFNMTQFFNISKFSNATYFEQGFDAATHFQSTAKDGTKIDFYSNVGDFDYFQNPPPDGSSNSPPDAGTINRFVVTTTTGAIAEVNNFSITVAQIFGWALSNDQNGFVNALFGGDDTFHGGGHGDVLEGFAGNDYFEFYSGGVNTALGDAGNDTFNVIVPTFSTASHFDGGDGFDTFSLVGSSNLPIVFGNATVQNIENLQFGSGGVNGQVVKMNIVMADGNVAAGATVQVGDNLDDNGIFTFDASAETNGNYSVIGGGGADTITTGAGSDFILTGGNFSVPGQFVGIDTISSGAGNDTISVSDKRVTINAGNDNDTINLGGYFEKRVLTAGDKIDGGAGNDKINFTSGPVTVKLEATTVTNVETFVLRESSAVGTYKIVTADGTVAAGATLTVDASSMSNDSVIVNGAKETDGSFRFIGGQIGSNANNPSIVHFTGGTGNDTFDMSGPAAALATLEGGGGSDAFNFSSNAFGYDVKPNGAHAARDTVIGGAGNDVVNIGGDYAQQLVFKAATLQQIETVNVLAGHDYSFLLAESGLAQYKVDASALAFFNIATFDASQLLKTAVELDGGAGDDMLIGGAKGDILRGGFGNDTLDITKGGTDDVHGDDGDDTIVAGNSFNVGDTIDGGIGNDTLKLSGNMGAAGAPVVLRGITSVETFDLAAGTTASPFAYHLQLADQNAATASGMLTVNGANLRDTDTLDIDGGHVVGGTLNLIGSIGADTLVGGGGVDVINGGKGADTITGGLGADQLTGGAGNDIFVYTTLNDSVAKSAANAFDHVTDFDFASDKFDFNVIVTGIDAPITGTTAPAGGLIAGALKADLFMLSAHHAVLYTSTDSHLYLVVDGNGDVGFQANGDYVVDITGAAHATSSGTTGVDLGDFI